MCGRFTIDISSEVISELFGLTEHPTISPRFNIAPTQQIQVIRQYADGGNHLDVLRWGLIPSWAKDLSIGARMINARCETVAEKPAFKQAIRYRRCLVLSSGFYEWTTEGKAKKPWYIRLKDGSPMIFAGLWDNWKSPDNTIVQSCTILTTSANPLIEPLHDRMPAILHPDEYRKWLDREVTKPADLQYLFQSYPADLMEMYPVSQSVNSPKNDSADLICGV